MHAYITTHVTIVKMVENVVLIKKLNLKARV